MCGIVGILNSNSLKTESIDILKKLEYRGYDSAGLSLFSQKRIKTIKSVGKISALEKKIKSISDKKLRDKNEIITNLPKFESDFVKLHKNFYNI